MEIIKTFQRTGYCLLPEVLTAAGRAGCALASFNSESSEPGIHRRNVVHNLKYLCDFKDDKYYSIIMDDDVVVKSEAIKQGIRHIQNYDIVTFPVNKYSRVQHAFMVVKNKYLEEHPFQLYNECSCNQCIWVGQAIDIHKAKILALKQPVLQTVENRTILKRSIK
jgi:hypothetical protein